MKKLSLVLCLLWMGFIFYNSSQSGTQSNDMSLSIVDKIQGDSSSEVKEETNEKRELVKFTNLIVRKGAHFFQFFVLALLVSLTLKCYGVKGVNLVIYTLFVVLSYAVLDEFHQLYVPGRTGKVSDIVIDFAGGVFGVVIYNCIKLIASKRAR